MNIKSIYYYTTTFETTKKQKDFETKSNYDTTRITTRIHCKLSYTFTTDINHYATFIYNDGDITNMYKIDLTKKCGTKILNGKQYYYNINNNYITLKAIY